MMMSIVASHHRRRALFRHAAAGLVADRGRRRARTPMPTLQWFMGSLIGRLILFGYTWALIHHMLGGIRHLIWDTGHGFGPAEREWLTRATLIGSIGAHRRCSGSSATLVMGGIAMSEHTPSSMRTPLGRVRGLGSRASGTEHFWHQRLTSVASVPLTHRLRSSSSCRSARPQPRRGGADPRLAARRDPAAAVRDHHRLSHVARHAGDHRGLRARRGRQARRC